jgi:formylmethanofuran dehydrogenase subunit C
MGKVELKLKKEPTFSLEAESITPDNFKGKTDKEIRALQVFHGNEKLTIKDFFTVKGSSGDNLEEIEIEITGDLTKVKRIGEKMSGGKIIINGDIGMHVGNSMTGGKIVVNGNAGDWAGAMMEGGELEINGNAGNYVGAAYRGNWVGMTNGLIKVKGSVGFEAMIWARGSTPQKRFPKLVCGSARQFLGLHNHGGIIICEGDAEARVAADQARGFVVVKGKVGRMMPSFKKIGNVSEIDLPDGEKISGNFIEYSGDHATSHVFLDKEKTIKGTGGRLFVSK